MKRSRRRFLKLLAAGSAVAATTPAAMLARAAAPKRPARRGAVAEPPAAKSELAPAVAEELRRQKASLAQSLQKVRDFPLPASSEPAFRFVPLVPHRKAGRP